MLFDKHMGYQELLADKSFKGKQKTEVLCEWITQNPNELVEFIDHAKKSKDPIKATCIEALEYASKKDAMLINKSVFNFAVEALSEKAPRIKWESAKVVGNTVHLFSDNLDEAISHLLVNTEDTGTVVRWSAAYALGEIVKLKTKHNTDLIPAIEAIIKREEKNSIVKIYTTALKQL